MSLLHFAPRFGWMNDPNGLVEWHGRHHMFFQYNPSSTRFGNQHWGHASSADLLTWAEHPVALVPGDEGRTPYDSDGCFSGCAVPSDGEVVLLYTGVRRPDELPCVARSRDIDLRSFSKDPSNPVIARQPSADVDNFRDHTVWRDGTRWWQAIAGSRAGTGTAFAYSSTDLRHWEDAGVLIDATHVDLPTGVWECPDVFVVGDVAALIVSVILDDIASGPEVWWVTGSLVDGRLEPHAVGPLDIGNRLYATQSYWSADGRRLMFGWTRTHLDPASHGAPALGAMSLPRRLDIQDGRVTVQPAEELEQARSGSPDVHTLDAVGPTTIRMDPRAAGELCLDGNAADIVRAVTLVGPSSLMTIDCADLAGGSALTVYWDAGIVEAFGNDRAGVWTDLTIGTVDQIVIRHDPVTNATVPTATIWRLRAPDL